MVPNSNFSLRLLIKIMSKKNSKASSSASEVSYEDIERFDPEELCDFLQDQPDIRNDSDTLCNVCEVIRKHKIKGVNFLNYTFEMWAKRLPDGYASMMVLIAQKQKPKNQEMKESGANKFDVSERIYDEMSMPLEEEVPLQELQKFFELDTNCKFPVRYHIAKKISEAAKDVTFVQASDIEEVDCENLLGAIAEIPFSHHDRGEASTHFYIDLLVKVFLMSILNVSCPGAFLEFERVSSDDDGDTEKSLRPDFLCYVNGYLLLKGEERATASEFPMAEAELLSKMRVWNPVVMGELPFVFCYACAGSMIRFSVLTKELKLVHISKMLDLAAVKDRYRILHTVLNMTRFFRTFADILPPRKNIRLFGTIKHGDIEVFTDCDRVIKNIEVDPEKLRDRLNVMEKLYDDMKDAEVPNVIKCRRIRPTKRNGSELFNTITLELTPIAVEVKPMSEKVCKSAIQCVLKALSAFHKLGYVHRDIRWSNVLSVTETEWILVDFEKASKPDKPIAWNNDSVPPEVQTGSGWISASDIYQVGMLMRELTFPLTSQMEDLVRVLTFDEPTKRMSANQALRHRWFN
jgi:hypothetical protein